MDGSPDFEGAAVGSSEGYEELEGAADGSGVGQADKSQQLVHPCFNSHSNGLHPPRQHASNNLKQHLQWPSQARISLCHFRLNARDELL